MLASAILTMCCAFVVQGAAVRHRGQQETVTEKCPPSKSSSLKIVLTNDDGFETDLIQSLYFALEDAGHQVIMSAPYSGQSGTSGLIEFFRPLSTTSSDSPKGTILKGAPALGNTTLGTHQYYVAGAVTSAILYGVDVLAPRLFGGPPDLVLSGPNEGNNVGIVTPHSGTIGAAVTALNKGIPSIAISGDSDEPQPEVVAELIVEMLNRIQASYSNGAGLPKTLGLNVNVPSTEGYTMADFTFKQTEIGISSSVGLRFVENLQTDCPIAVGVGVNVSLPGMCVVVPYTEAGYPEDLNPTSEYNAILSGPVVAISPMQGTYAGSSDILVGLEGVFD